MENVHTRCLYLCKQNLSLSKHSNEVHDSPDVPGQSIAFLPREACRVELALALHDGHGQMNRSKLSGRRRTEF